MSTGPDRPDAGADDDRTSDRTARILGGATAADGSLDDFAGRRPRTGSARERSARLDEALAQYRDTTYATWTAPGGPVDVSPLADRRIIAELRAAPAPSLPSKRLRYAAVGVGAVAASVLAVVVALSTLGQPGTVEPDDGVLLAAATPGGDRGVLADAAALHRCLDAARVPAAKRTVLGAGSVQVRGKTATVLLLPGPTLGDLTLLAVSPTCADGASSAVLVTRTLAAAGRAAPQPPRTP